jgi:hypothetical protein
VGGSPLSLLALVSASTALASALASAPVILEPVPSAALALPLSALTSTPSALAHVIRSVLTISMRPHSVQSSE